MSGQPVRTPADQNKFRNEYMEYLDLQEEINDTNLQAIKTYKLTGQLPPQSQMIDTRTNAEKLKDTILMKKQIAQQLAPIAEPQFALAIVDKIASSPLNIDNSLFRFLGQRATSIAESLSKIMPYGIAGDENDLETIVDFIKNMYSEQQSKFQSTKSYINSSNSSQNNSRLLSANDIDSIITQLNEFLKIIYIQAQRMPKPLFDRLQATGSSLFDIIVQLKNNLPTTQELKLLLSEIDNTTDPNTVGNELRVFFDILEKLPKFTQVMAMFNKSKKFLELGQYESVFESIVKLKDLFGEVIGGSGENLKILQRVGQTSIRRQKEKIRESENAQEVQTRQFIRAQTEAQKDATKAQKVYVVNPYNDPVNVNTDPQAPPEPGAGGPSLATTAMAGLATGALAGATMAGYPQAMASTLASIPGAVAETVKSGAKSVVDALTPPKEESKELVPYGTPLEESPEAQRAKINEKLNDLYNEPVFVNPYLFQAETPEMGTMAPAYNELEMGDLDEIKYHIDKDWYDTQEAYDRIKEILPEPVTDFPGFGQWGLSNYKQTMQAPMYLDKPQTPYGFFDQPQTQYSDYYGLASLPSFGAHTALGYGIRPTAYGYGIRPPPPRMPVPRSIQGYGIRPEFYDNRYQAVEPSYKANYEIATQTPRKTAFVGFGLAEINKKSLDKGIIKLRRAGSKSNFMDLPSKQVSEPFQKIIHSIIGGGVPKYEDLQQLDDEEVEYLNKLVSKASLQDRLTVPAPTKDSQEKDIHNFEVMKGQLMSGNDNKEMIKKFKALTIKLAKQGLLPRREVDDMMELFNELGL